MRSRLRFGRRLRNSSVGVGLCWYVGDVVLVGDVLGDRDEEVSGDVKAEGEEPEVREDFDGVLYEVRFRGDICCG